MMFPARQSPHAPNFAAGAVEIEWAIKRASIDPESERVLNRAGDLMAQLDQYMKKKNMRVVDLFNALDTAQTGSVTSTQFRNGLVTIFGVSGFPKTP